MGRGWERGHIRQAAQLGQRRNGLAVHPALSSCDWIIDISTYQPRAAWVWVCGCVCMEVNQGGLSGRAGAHSAWGMGILAEWGLR